MIEKIKYHLSRAIASCQMRIAAVALMTAITVAVVTLMSYSIYTVNIFDGETTYTVRTLNNDVLSVLDGLTLKSDSYSVRDTNVRGRTTTVNIAYTFPVYIVCGDKTATIEFTGGTVEEALQKAGLEIDEYDMVEPALDTMISKTTYIDYVDIDYISGTYTEEIPYSTKTVYSSDKLKGVSTLMQSGSNGLKEVTYTEKLQNGVSIEKTVISSSVIKDAVDEKVLVGTRVIPNAVMTSADVKATSVLVPNEPIPLDANGNPVNYKSKMTVRATAYTYTGNNCATGVAPAPGYIAVNPNVIPYGTKLYIKSPDGRIVYGYAVAADTGGFIKKHPTGIDLFMSSVSACKSFGVRNMEVYILE